MPSTFIIVRDDEEIDALTFVAEGLKIGRDESCELLLNHPTVSRLHAGIREIEGRFYLFHLSLSNSTTINGRVAAAEQPEAIADGDEVRIGPFFLYFRRADDALEIRVTLQIGLLVGQDEGRSTGTTAGTGSSASSKSRRAAKPSSAEVANALALFWGKRTRDKAARPSPLHPRQAPSPGKARFNWRPTRDLVRPWPFSIFIWATIIVAGLSVVAAVWYTSAYSPAPLSAPHARASFSMNPPVAERPNAGACMSCHSLRVSMDANCESCHQTQSFTATNTQAHENAGIGCITCHDEHKGQGFRPVLAAFNSCAECHNDANKKLYNGQSVHTPHGGTIGYPVVGGEWVWNGLGPEELAEKPEIAALRQPADSKQKWLSKQFHAVHLYRVRATGDVRGVENTSPSGAVTTEMSCSSCHKSFVPIDRDTPRMTCKSCHSARFDERGGQMVLAADAPNCTSCHIQHAGDKRHWNPSLLNTEEIQKLQSGAGQNSGLTQR